jgi:hypothetical protein
MRCTPALAWWADGGGAPANACAGDVPVECSLAAIVTSFVYGILTINRVLW